MMRLCSLFFASVLVWSGAGQTIDQYLLENPHSVMSLRGDAQTQVQALAQLSAATSSASSTSSSSSSDVTGESAPRDAEPRARGQDLLPVTPDQSVLDASVKDEEGWVGDGTACPKHDTEFKCIIDVACGWCMQPQGKGQCVRGTYAGPSPPYKGAVYCPVYTTYQVYLPPDPPGSADAYKNMFDAINKHGSSSHNFDADLLPKPVDAAETVQQSQYPHPDLRNDYGLNEDEIDLGDEADKEEKKSTTIAPPPPKPIPPKKRGKSVEPHTRASIPMDPNNTGFGSTTSPCGLPGVPQEFCDAWLKTHCGPDQLTDEHVMDMEAANNPYDWCKMLFENEPGITLPEVDVFPWIVNGKEVDLSQALKDKIRFGHPLAGQGVGWAQAQKLELKRGWQSGSGNTLGAALEQGSQ